MNKPYVKEYNELGEVINKIDDFYQSCNNTPFDGKTARGSNPFPNRSLRRQKGSRNNNRKQHPKRLQIISRKRMYDDESEEFIGYKEITPKKILHN